jgi:hypothetical protein
MQTLTRWFAPALLAAGLGLGAMTPAPAQAQDSVARVLVDVADVAFNAGTPYYRYGSYGPGDRLVMGRDAYGRPVYYRQVPYRQDAYRGTYDPRTAYPVYQNGYGTYHGAYDRSGPPYGNAYGYYRHGPGSRSHTSKHDRRHADGWNAYRHDDEDGDRDGRRHHGHDRDDD